VAKGGLSTEAKATGTQTFREAAANMAKAEGDDGVVE
jgi:hypothetical protein